MNENIIIPSLVIAIIAILLYVLLGGKKKSQLLPADGEISAAFEKLEKALREESARQREELNSNFKSLREEIGSLLRASSEMSLKNSTELSSMQKGQLEIFSSELSKNIKFFEEKLSKNILDFTGQQRQKMEDLENRHSKMKADTETLLEKIRDTMEKNLKSINEENSRKLEEMRKTVDEKLHESLEKRLSQSFNQVSERLKQVYEGLGEMKTLATGVGDLKKVLSNVKTRGIMGEIQLEAILENILSPSQYDKALSVKPGSRENVEFAVKMPGGDGGEPPVYIPIDSKFPVERYEKLVKAYDESDKKAIEEELANLEKEIRRCAKEISEKYINPPVTTDFAIMFLPFEGLYAEVVKNSSLVDKIQREYRVSVTGPSTLAAFLNCIQMGFRSLAIKQRTTEVWSVLSAVKTEFGKFGETLDKARKKLHDAGEEIDELVGKRTRKIQSKLKSVEELPEYQAKALTENDSE
ncbi:MAG TPA: DNA recombination protein RmuC [Victivallales bacterium]|mgnify:CR=1 FL=1|nr:DNA recombination protein RmuC [Victivallales bacterium]